MAERKTNGDTSAKELKRRRIELFSAITILCFGLINYLDILGKKESSGLGVSNNTMQETIVNDIKQHIDTELEKRDTRFNEKLADLKEDVNDNKDNIRELMMIRLSRGRGTR